MHDTTTVNALRRYFDRLRASLQRELACAVEDWSAMEERWEEGGFGDLCAAVTAGAWSAQRQGFVLANELTNEQLQTLACRSGYPGLADEWTVEAHLLMKILKPYRPDCIDSLQPLITALRFVTDYRDFDEDIRGVVELEEDSGLLQLIGDSDGGAGRS